MRTNDRPPATPLDHLARSLRARTSTPTGQAKPTAILWTDPKAEWRALPPGGPKPASPNCWPSAITAPNTAPARQSGFAASSIARSTRISPPTPPPSSTSPEWNAASCGPVKTAPTNSNHSSN